MIRQQSKVVRRGSRMGRRPGVVIRMPNRRAGRRKRLFALAATGIAIAAATSIIFRLHLFRIFPSPERARPGALDAAALILQEVNQARIGAGLTPLRSSRRLADIAGAHSRDMAIRHYFSHDTPDRISPEQRLHAAGINYAAIGENIYEEDGGERGGLAERVVHGWLRSPPHRKNMLSADFTRTGVGVARDSAGAVYVTEDFVKE